MATDAILEAKLADLAQLADVTRNDMAGFILMLGEQMRAGLDFDAAVAAGRAKVSALTTELLNSESANREYPAGVTGQRWAEFEAGMAADLWDTVNGVAA